MGGANIAGRSRLGNTALHYAAYRRSDEIARALLANGAPIEAVNLEGRTLQVATSEGILPWQTHWWNMGPVGRRLRGWGPSWQGEGGSCAAKDDVVSWDHQIR